MVSKNGLGKKVMGAALSTALLMSAVPAATAFASENEDKSEGKVVTIIINPANEELEALLDETEANFAMYSQYLPASLREKLADKLERGRFNYEWRTPIPNRDYYITQWCNEINEELNYYKPAEEVGDPIFQVPDGPVQNPDQKPSDDTPTGEQPTGDQTFENPNTDPNEQPNVPVVNDEPTQTPDEDPAENPAQDPTNDNDEDDDEDEYRVCVPLYFEEPETDNTPVQGGSSNVDASSVITVSAPVNVAPSIYRDLMAEQFVDRLYIDGLARIADEAGRTNWLNGIITGEKSYADVATSIIGSSEFSTRNLSDEEFVTVLYKAMFGRTASADEQAAWVEALASGSSRSEVVNAFVNSSEFMTDYMF